MKRLTICLVLLAMALAPLGVQAETYTVSISQFVEHPALDAVNKGFKDYLKEAGIDVAYNDHNAQANMGATAQIASQIMGEAPNLVLAIATPPAQACAQKIKDIPILATAVTDLVGAGLVQSMEKPGANVTGMTDMSPVGEQVDLIREFQPNIQKIGIIFTAGEANAVTLKDILVMECGKRSISVEEAAVVNSSGVYQAAKSLVGRCEAIYIATDNTVVSAFESVVKVGNENKLPVYAADNDSVVRGAVAALAVDYYRMGRQSGAMAQRILTEGAKPADMPVETLKELELHVNKKAAEAMGVTIPEAVLKRANKIIE